MTLPPEPAAELSPDTAFGAFSDQGPWVLDLDAIPWQWDIDRIRRGTRREVPRLLASGRLPPLGRLIRTMSRIGIYDEFITPLSQIAERLKQL